jgi:hypothetical protein
VQGVELALARFRPASPAVPIKRNPVPLHRVGIAAVGALPERPEGDRGAQLGGGDNPVAAKLFEPVGPAPVGAEGVAVDLRRLERTVLQEFGGWAVAGGGGCIFHPFGRNVKSVCGRKAPVGCRGGGKSMAKGWMPVRALDFRIDLAARNSAVAIKARGGSAAEQFLRRLAVHLDEAPDDDGGWLRPLDYPDMNTGRLRLEPRCW